MYPGKDSEVVRLKRLLSIEKALDKVSVVAMRMKERADMLHVCKTISQQLQKLGVTEIRNVQTAIFYTERGSYMNYEYYTKHDKTFITDTLYTNHKIAKDFAAKMLKGKGEFMVKHIKGEKVKQWLAYQKTTNVFIDKFLKTASSLSYYWFSLGPVALGISTYKPLTNDELGLFKKFLHVFELAYTRYLDIEKAEAQAREAQIQLALERVRAKTMAMQRSEELSDVVYILFQQFKELGENPDQATIGVINEEEHVIEYWVTMYGNQMNRVFKFSIDEPNVTNKIYKAWKENKKSLVIDLSGKSLRAFTHYRESMGGAKYDPNEKRRIINVAFFSKGLLNVQSNEQRSEESLQLLERFASVFEQTYTRFLDLKKAEALAREAQIEVGLERIRSRAMAMQSSDELKVLIGAVFTELTKLDLALTRCVIWVFEQQTNDARWWMANSEDTENPANFYIKYHDYPAYLAFVNAWKKQTLKFIYDLNGEDKIQWDNILFEQTELKNLPEFVKDGMRSSDRIILSGSFNNFGGIHVSSTQPLSEEHFDILLRFAKVFDLTYTRFLDLKNAEAQARESQIQLALERVRARTMAMQKSEDMNLTASEMFKQIQGLGIQPWACGFNIFDKDEKAVTQYMSLADGGISPPFRTPLTEDPFFINIYNARQNKNELLVMESKGESLAETYRYMFSLPGSAEIFGDLESSGFEMPKFQITHCAYFLQGYLVFITYEPVPEMHDIFKRFAKVFEQTYTRFLDLQKSEAQAREAQIQLALERVRARTMAMQKSEELAETASLLFQQVKALDIETYASGFTIWENNDNDLVSWMCNADGSVNPPFKMPAGEIEWHKRQYESWKNKETYIIKDFTGKDMKEHYKYLRSFPLLDEAFKKSEAAGVSTPERQVHNAFNFSYGNLLFITYEPVPETYDIFQRFAKTFDQTYTRFLDLQKAEAQAREAKIEVALERVRSRSMAMHKSEELADLSLELVKQIQRLGIDTWFCAFNIYDDNPKGSLEWGSNGQGTFPMYRTPRERIFLRYYEAGHSGEKLLINEIAKEECTAHYEYLCSLPGVGEQLLKMKEAGIAFPTSQIDHVAFFKYGYIIFITYESLPETYDIFKRFAKVFEQTYTRFLDLQKAEAQAREAQIEAALEKVRSRSLAMHHSSELEQVAASLYERLKELGLPLDGALIFLFDKEKRNIQLWIATTHLSAPVKIEMPYDEEIRDNEILKDLWNAIGNGKHIFNKSYSGEIKNDYFRYVQKYNGEKIPEPIKKLELEREQWTAFLVAEKNAVIGFDSWMNQVVSEEDFLVLKRFATVFDQAYIRFLDLQKAEAQAREAQIEAALERVRSRTMAMQKSEDLREVVRILYIQLNKLGFQQGAASIIIMYPDSSDIDWWMEGFGDGYVLPEKYHVPNFNHRGHLEQIAYWKNGTTYAVVEISGQEKKSYDNYYFFHTDFINAPENTKQLMMQQEKVLFSMAFMQYGALCWSPSQITDEQSKILQRFAKVFEQTYTRFLDLQKAEAQAREAEVQLALERVRARTMAMQESSELAETAKLFFEQFRSLQLNQITCAIMLVDEKQNMQRGWTVKPDGTRLTNFIDFPLTGDDILKNRFDAWKKKINIHKCIVDGESSKQHHRFLAEVAPQNFSEDIIQYLPDKIVFYSANFSSGYIHVLAPHELSNKEEEIIEQFARVFEQTYTRFLDLQKAEAQAREAEIQLALERVRAKTMAMQHSKELREVIITVFEKLKELQLTFEDTGIQLYTAGSKDIMEWVAAPDQLAVPTLVNLPFSEKDYKESEMFRDILLAREKGKSLFNKSYSVEEKNKYFSYVGKFNEFSQVPEEVRQFQYEASSYTISLAAEKNSALWIDSWYGQTISPEDWDILKRFAKVFDQAYTRFLDLQKAEAQAREAQIEAALERVRSRSLAMHKSDELKDVVNILFEKLKDLGLEFDGGAGIHLFKQGTKDAQILVAAPNLPHPIVNMLPYDEEAFVNNPIINDVWHAKETGKHIFNKCYLFEEKNKYFNYVFKYNDSTIIPEAERDFILKAASYTATFIAEKNSLLGANSWTGQTFSKQDFEILKRFAKVFEQAYIRFLDLQKAEARAREALIEAALERVRSRTMAMQKSEELSEVAAILFKQVSELGIKTWTAGFNVWSDDENFYTDFITTPQGNIVKSYTIDTRSFSVFKEIRDAKKSGLGFLIQYLEGDLLQETYKRLAGFSNENQYDQMLADGFEFPSHQYDHFVFSSKVSLMFITYEEVSAEIHDIFKRFGKVFEQTYTRFLDLKKAEEQAIQAEKDLIEIMSAKKKAEDALAELQLTQKQLVQAEKMASLGELTAGIAHEIQNPLNFVNNFSEVSNELIAEMNEELDKGDIEEAKAIATDIKLNLEKINHHGKRADAIVKGMLQHSRASSGQKELTDINALCDEYLRLAYHGLRAKDKTFNAKFETDFDNSIEKISIVPQDIGRVILNLINNAFFAVTEKKKNTTENFEPTVTITTKKFVNKISISVTDNGSGIPEAIKEKIFQPFFTTKPTGQGTGLGLSLSYDIIKAHDGELKVETEENKGSIFTIVIPVR